MTKIYSMINCKSYREVSAKLGISEHKLKDVCCGRKNRSFKLKEVSLIAKNLGISESELLGLNLDNLSFADFIANYLAKLTEGYVSKNDKYKKLSTHLAPMRIDRKEDGRIQNISKSTVLKMLDKTKLAEFTLREICNAFAQDDNFLKFVALI